MSFKYLEADVTGEKLTHITHTEDLLLSGSKAADFALKALYSVYDMLKGSTPKESVKVTSKWDGAPSVAAATDFYGKKFVATKGFFAKDRRIAYTEEDCDRYYGHAPDLAKKMKLLLAHLDEIKIPKNQIWQGDFLFDKDSLKREVVDGEEYITFHPNTIVYAVPVTDPLADKLLKADLGVVWHTRYEGPDFDSLKISFNVDVDELAQSAQIFCIDARLPSIAGIVTLTKEETDKVDALLDELNSIIEDLHNSNFLDYIANDEELQTYLAAFENYLIKTKAKQFLDSPVEHIHSLKDWVASRYDKEIAAKKQSKTKEAYQAKKEAALAKIDDNVADIVQLLEAQQLIVTLKEFFIEKLNKASSYKTLLKTIDKGFIPASPEGYAVSDVAGDIQKFVSRLNFSYSNFSKEIVKGWISDARMRERKSVPELKMDIISHVQSTSDENTLIRAYNAINQITVEDVKKIIKDKFSSKTTLDLVADILASSHPTDIENPDYLKCLYVFCTEGLVTIPEDGAVIDYNKAAREKAVALAAKYSIDSDIALKVVDYLISKLLNLTFTQNTVSVGKGEILFALIIKNAAKRNVGDLSVGNLHFELKGQGARLSGSGAQGGLLAKPTYIASLIKKYIVENFSDIPLKFLKEPTSLNVYATGPLLLVELAHALTNNPDRLRDMATRVTDIICSLVSKPSRHQELQQQMIQAILNQDWYLFRNLLLAYHFESYKERANWDSLLMFNSAENVIARFDSSSSFIEAVKNGYIHIIPFQFSPGRQEIGTEREAGFKITLQVYHKASEPIPRILKKEKGQELKKQKLLDTIATLKATLQAKTAQIQNSKLTPTKRNAINKSIQGLNIRIQKLEQQIGAL